MNQTKKIILVAGIFIVILLVVISVGLNRSGKPTQTIPTLTTSETSPSAAPMSYAFPSPPVVKSVVFPSKFSLPLEMPVYTIATPSSSEADSNIFTLTTSLSLATPSSRVKNNEMFSYKWRSDSSSASYTRTGISETLSFQRMKSNPSATLSGSIEKSALEFLVRISSKLPDILSWNKTGIEKSGFEGLLLDNPSLALEAFTYALLVNGAHIFVFPNQTTEAARIVVDERGEVRSFSGFLPNFVLTEYTKISLASFDEIQKRIATGQSPIIDMTGRYVEPDNTRESFASVSIDEVKTGYCVNKEESYLTPCFLVSGETNKKGIRITYLVDAIQ